MLVGFDDKTAYAQCVFAFSPGPNHEPKVFVGQCPGKIVAARGPNSFGWDPIFEPDGTGQTFAEMDKTEKNKISHRYRSVEKLKTYLKEHASELMAPLDASTTTANADDDSNAVTKKRKL
jgi:XTP/dITP diphosphohydrolase